VSAALSRLDRHSRWERAELGRRLRRLGWSYAEIGGVLPAAKATIAGWCRGIELTPEQRDAILARTGSRAGIPTDTQRRRRHDVEAIRAAAAGEVAALVTNPFWVAGTVLYWAEGTKSVRSLRLTNSDPRALRLFCSWVRTFQDSDAELVLALHLHEGNDEGAAREHWRAVLDLPECRFHKTFTKPAGTGQRKNTLPWGVCQVRVARSGDAWHRTMGWIDELSRRLVAAD